MIMLEYKFDTQLLIEGINQNTFPHQYPMEGT